MLEIIIPAMQMELFDEKTNRFIRISTKDTTLRLEHSLVSLAKWESKWGKPFLSKKEKTFEETIDYIKCMTLTQNVNDDVYSALTMKNVEDINAYIESPMTATTFPKEQSKRNGEQITAELIYYWMIAMNIPMECQKWHLNRLLTLIKVCSVKNQPPKKMSQREIMNRNTALNQARRQKLNSKG